MNGREFSPSTLTRGSSAAVGGYKRFRTQPDPARLLNRQKSKAQRNDEQGAVVS
jgi:hypothetical protein